VRSILWVSVCLCLILPPARAATYLVLPFFNLSKDPNLDWMGESLAESVREALSSEGLMALNRDDRIEAYSRLSLRPYSLLTKASVVKVGEELDAEQVIFGQYDVKPAPDSAQAAPDAAGKDGERKGASLLITARVLDLKRLKEGPESRGAAGTPGVADPAVSQTGGRAIRGRVPRAAPGSARGCHRKLYSRPAGGQRRRETPLLHASRAAG
jgi:hypothetical protein